MKGLMKVSFQTKLATQLNWLHKRRSLMQDKLIHIKKSEVSLQKRAVFV
jgi:hypothetical protein